MTPRGAQCGGDAHGLTVSWFEGVEAREPWLRPVRVARMLATTPSASNHNGTLAQPVHTRVRRALFRRLLLGQCDLTLLIGFLDTLVTKNRLKALAGGVS